jgi:hypothetical protein
MTIHIPISNLEPKVRKLYLEDKLIGGLGIDYAPNAIVSYYDGKIIEVFNFSKIMQMDNRYTGYNIYKNPTEIVIEITGLPY